MGTKNMKVPEFELIFEDRTNYLNQIRTNNIRVAMSVTEAIRTSLGPRGMDKMIAQQNGEVLISNDGATILKKLEVTHPVAKMLVELAESQDLVVGDGTTTVTVICGALLKKSLGLLDKTIHPALISDAVHKASAGAVKFLEKTLGIAVDLNDHKSLIKTANTSLSSKVVSQYSSLLSPIAVNCILKVFDPIKSNFIDLRNIKIIKKIGGTVDESEVVDGIILDNKILSKVPNRPRFMMKATICLAQFNITHPKSETESSVVISDHNEMDRSFKEERCFILQLIKKIKQSGTNVILLQKSILRESISDLGEHYLAKANIMVVKDIDRDEIDFICKTLHCTPVTHIDYLTPSALAYAEVVEEKTIRSETMIKITGIKQNCTTACVLLRGSNRLIIDEAERSLRDAFSVVKCLVQKQFIVPGGAACEIEIVRLFTALSKTLIGTESYCLQAFAEAIEIIPYTLAENAGLDPIQIIANLRARHARGNIYDGINFRMKTISNMIAQNVVQPLLVTSCALELASECVRMIIKVDDIIYK